MSGARSIYMDDETEAIIKKYQSDFLEKHDFKIGLSKAVCLLIKQKH